MGKRKRQLVGVDYLRQLRIFNPDDHRNVEVTIAGAGNIGSNTALALAKLGLKSFHIWDFDTVEAHNLSSQAFRVRDTGRSKVEALKEQMLEVNPEATVVAHNEPFTGKEQVGGIFVSAVDSMEGRRAIASNLPKGTYVIDGRMGGGQMEVWCRTAEAWPETLTRDGDEDPCGARFISYTSYIIGGLIANQVKRHILGERKATRILMHADTMEMIVERE